MATATSQSTPTPGVETNNSESNQSNEAKAPLSVDSSSQAGETVGQVLPLPKLSSLTESVPTTSVTAQEMNADSADTHSGNENENINTDEKFNSDGTEPSNNTTGNGSHFPKIPHFSNLPKNVNLPKPNVKNVNLPKNVTMQLKTPNIPNIPNMPTMPNLPHRTTSNISNFSNFPNLPNPPLPPLPSVPLPEIPISANPASTLFGYTSHIPVGPLADLKELEYCFGALHSTKEKWECTRDWRDWKHGEYDVVADDDDADGDDILTEGNSVRGRRNGFLSKRFLRSTRRNIKRSLRSQDGGRKNGMSFKRSNSNDGGIRPKRKTNLEQEIDNQMHNNGIHVTPQDIQLFLHSRYGLSVTSEEAIDVVRGLGSDLSGYLSDDSTTDKGFGNVAEDATASHIRNSSNGELQLKSGGASGIFVVDASIEEGIVEEVKSEDDGEVGIIENSDPMHSPSLLSSVDSMQFSQQSTQSIRRRKPTQQESNISNSNEKCPQRRPRNSQSNDSETKQPQHQLDLAQITSVLFIPTILRACHTELQLAYTNLENGDCSDKSKSSPLHRDLEEERDLLFEQEWERQWKSSFPQWPSSSTDRCEKSESGEYAAPNELGDESVQNESNGMQNKKETLDNDVEVTIANESDDNVENVDIGDRHLNGRSPNGSSKTIVTSTINQSPTNSRFNSSKFPILIYLMNHLYGLSVTRPNLRRIKKENDELKELRPSPKRIVRDVLACLLDPVQGKFDQGSGNRDGAKSVSGQMENSDSENGINAFAPSTTSTPSGSSSRSKKYPTMPSNPPMLTKSLLRTLFQTVGELQLANNDNLLSEMIEIAKQCPIHRKVEKANEAHGKEESPIKLNEAIFAYALSSDVDLYPIQSEDRVSTSFYDVFGFDMSVNEDEYRSRNFYGGGYYFEPKTKQNASIHGRAIREASEVTPERTQYFFNKPSPPLQMISDLKTEAREITEIPRDMVDFFQHSDLSSQQSPLDVENTGNDNVHDSLNSKIKLEQAEKAIETGNEDVAISGIMPHRKRRGVEDKASRRKKGLWIIKNSTGSSIDYVVDNYGSLVFTLVVWLFYAFNAGILMSIITEHGIFHLENCGRSFHCNLFNQVINWAGIAISLVLLGLMILVPVSWGNNANNKSVKSTLCSMVTVAIFTVIPYFLPQFGTSFANGHYVYWASVISVFVSGILLEILLLCHICFIYIPLKHIHEHRLLRRIFLPASVFRTSNIKRAATHKINKMIENAYSMHRISYLQNGKVRSPSTNFLLFGARSEEFGGLIASWKLIISNDLEKKLGIWIHSRLMVGQEGQIIGCLFLMATESLWVESLVKRAEDLRAQFTLTTYESNSVTEWALWVIPEGWMIRVSAYVGGTIGLIIAAFIFLIYVPSTISTIVKYRTGVISSFGNPVFSKFREAIDYIYGNLATIVYSLMGAFALFALLVGFLIFLFVWPPSQSGMLLFVSWALGLTIIIILRNVIVYYCIAPSQMALYRSHPQRANYSAIMLESLSLGLGSGIILGRISQFLFASAFWVGRVDQPFLDDNVSLLGYSFDYYPTFYVQELLIHEAHRHPYMERISAMYLMRLLHGKRFSSKAGAAWRLLFVLTLMPWLRKYREHSSMKVTSH